MFQRQFNNINIEISIYDVCPGDFPSEVSYIRFFIRIKLEC